MNILAWSASHLSEDDLFALPVFNEQQEAADEQLLLQRETLSIRAAAARRRHAVAVHLRQHTRDLREADSRRCTRTRGQKEIQLVHARHSRNKNGLQLVQIKPHQRHHSDTLLTFTFSF